MENKEINGSVSVSNNANIGGDVLVQGDSHIKGNVKVDGVLEAENIKGVNNKFAKIFLGYHYGVSSVLRDVDSPQPGMFFVNGETNSVWVWDAIGKQWIDTNRVDSGMKGMLNDDKGNSPSDFVPSPQSGINESYFYVAECDDCDLNPNAKPKDITFTYFKNGNSSVSVTVRKTSIITLFWNGTYWETSVVPIAIKWNMVYPRMFKGILKAKYVDNNLMLFTSYSSATENEEFITNSYGGDLGGAWRVQGDQAGILISGWWNLVLITPKSHFVFRYSDENGNEIPSSGEGSINDGGYWRKVTEYNHITQDERKEWNKVTQAVSDIANIKPNVLNGKLFAYLEDGKYKLYSKYEPEGEKIEFTSNSMGGAVGNVWRVSGHQGGIIISGWNSLLLISPTNIIKFKHNGETQGWEEDNNTSLVQLGTSINEVKTDLDAYKTDLGYRKLNVNVTSGQSPNMFSLEPYRGKEVCVKVTGDFSSFGYRDPNTDIKYKTLANSDKNGEWVTFIPSDSAGDFFVYKSSSIADSYVDVDFRANLAKEVTKVEEIDAIDAKIGFENITKTVNNTNSVGFYDITKYRGSTIAVKVTGVFSSFGYFKPTVDNPNAYKPLGEEPDKYVTFEVPEDATSLYVYNNTGANEEVTMSVRANAGLEIAESNTLATQAKEEVTAIDAKIGFAEYKDISYKTLKKVFSLVPYRGNTVAVKVTGYFQNFGYYYGTEGKYNSVRNKENYEGGFYSFVVKEDATDFYVYTDNGGSTVDIDFRANLAKEVTKVEEIDAIDAKIGFENITKTVNNTNSVGFYDITKYRGSTIAVKVTGVFSSFGYFKPTVDNPNAYKPLGEEPDKYVTFEVPEDATSLYVYNNTGANEEVTMSVRANAGLEIAESNTLATQAKEEVTAIDAKIGFAEYKDISYKTLKKVFSLVPYRGNTVAVKVTGYFQNFGYYYGTEGKYNSVRNKENYEGGFYSFVVKEDATDFYVYTDNGGSTVDIDFRANLAALIGNNEVPTKGCVFMSLGDSITTESYYIKPLREILQPSKYYNLAVAGAWWADKNGTRYDGNPQFNGADNNVNNVIGNQVQKIIDNPDDYAEAPDIIIIAAGTNDSGNLGVSNNAPINDMRSTIDLVYQNRDGIIPISEPTFDENDTYKEFRKTIAGAMRYCVTKLQQIFPRAKIYILTPIQGCFDSKDYYWGIATKQEYISECAKHLGVPVIHVGEECGINSDFEWRGAMWTAPTGSHERSGRDLIDGLHPNANGSKKMADYIANYIINNYRK